MRRTDTCIRKDIDRKIFNVGGNKCWRNLRTTKTTTIQRDNAKATLEYIFFFFCFFFFF
ncbi:hypothetical protein PUN28_008609 [Cardiocondyla obscurior]|uniref:Uncharacterized protein n=1 Tax=Cardiocondyla obscurior TaxID=286306 RepID=A0AAW2G0C0_9HYME